MTTSSAKILIVDDEPFNVEILLEYLEESGYHLDTAEDGEEAWEKLSAAPDEYDVVILDRMMPRMDGLEVLQRIKGHPVLQSVPVILQTALAAKDEILEGIQAGAYYYLTKPFEEELLQSVLGTAVEDRMRYRAAQQQSCQAGRVFGFMRSGTFHFKTLEGARDLAVILANACPNPHKVVIGLTELLVNAVEHGNLAISYEEKSQLREQNTWEQEIDRRLADPQFCEREVVVEFRRNSNEIRVAIVDQGNGFDWQQYLDIDPARAFDTHGRGIAMSRLISFDNIEYRGSGNEVVVSVALSEAAAEAA